MIAPARVPVCLDLNVFVAAEIARAKGRAGTVPIRLVDACCGGAAALVISVAMLDRLRDVLQRPPLHLTSTAAAARTTFLARFAVQPGLLVVGGGIVPIRDEEDRHVLETALAGGARYLATYNLKDFENIAVLDPALGHLTYRNLGIVHPSDLARKLGI